MPKPLDLLGKSFGNLTVVRRVHAQELEEVYRRMARLAFWLCACKCGSEALRSSVSLTRGQATHCGCKRRRQIEGEHDGLPAERVPRRDLAGQRFGILTAIAAVGLSSQGWSWSLRCDCGRDHIARTKDLANGNTASCGCLKGARGVPFGQPAMDCKRPWRKDTCEAN